MTRVTNWFFQIQKKKLPRGFEPTTSALLAPRSNQLSYTVCKHVLPKICVYRYTWISSRVLESSCTGCMFLLFEGL
jgi:hypothetical protein